MVDRLVRAWERTDVPALVELLAEDVRFAMPPLPAWFDGRPAVVRFLSERVFETPWRLVPATANGQLAFACYQRQSDSDAFLLSAINVVSLGGNLVTGITGFLDRDVFAWFPFPPEYPG